MLKLQKHLLRRKVLMPFTMLLCGEDTGGGEKKVKYIGQVRW